MFGASSYWPALALLLVLGHLQTALAQSPATPPFDSASCVSSSPRRTTLDLILPDASPRQWLWNDQHRTRMLPLSCSAVDGNVWPLNHAVGGVTISQRTSLDVAVDLSEVQTHAYIVGYPEILYGYKPFQSVNTRQAAPFLFPVAVRELPETWVAANYNINVPDDRLPFNFSYDFWVTRAFKPNKVLKGDIELMVWLYHHELKPAGKLLSQRGFVADVWVNGALRKVAFDVYGTDPDIKGHTSLLLTFAARDQEAAGSLTGGWQHGYLAFDLRVLLQQMVSVMSSQYGWDAISTAQEYLNGIELGSEFARSGDRASLQWSLAAACLVRPANASAKPLRWKDLACPAPNGVRASSEREYPRPARQR